MTATNKKSGQQRNSKKSKPAKQGKPPASGERAAVTGYLGQYGVAADIIINHLASKRLEWIAIADPSAGRVDDFQLGTSGRIDAYQVKWSQFSRYLTLYQCIKPEKDKPNLIAQLADGWKRLSNAHPGQRVIVHLVTNNIASPADSVRTPKDLEPSHFAAFLADAWQKVKLKNPITPVDLTGKWSTTWHKIRTASGITNENEFCQFLQNFELDLNYVPFDNLKDRIGLQLPASVKDFCDIRAKLFEMVADQSQIIKISRDALLTQIGWKAAFTLRHSNLLAVTAHYQPIEETEEQLKARIATTTKGYLLLSGDPGSGKSTIVTKVIPELIPRTAFYYAYLPGGLDNKIRGESESFLHDITLELERLNLNRLELNPNGRAALLACLQSQLVAAGEHYRTTNERTCIVIDGLDHIDREQHVSIPLYSSLPNPGDVPDGVLFVLSSQSKSMLPSEIQNHVAGLRELTMSRLSQHATALIAESASKHLMDVNQLNKIFTLTLGHPLALSYLLNELENAELTELNEILDDAIPFAGELEDYYSSHWARLPKNVRDALSQLALIEGTFDIRTIQSLYEDSCPELLKKARQYFYRESTFRWLFFHNSFRQFIFERSSLNEFGEQDESVKIRHHYELSKKLANVSPQNDLSWQRTFHLEAGQAPSYEIANSIDAEFARTQLLNYRELRAIRSDISTALVHAARARDVISTLRLLLLEDEFSNRSFRYDENDFDNVTIETLIDLGQDENAMKRIRNGNSLRVSRMAGFRYAQSFHAAGNASLGKEVFQIAEPYFEIHHLPELDSEFLMDWAYTAGHFFSISDLHSKLYDANSSKDILVLVPQLLMAAGIGRIHSHNSDEAIELLSGQYCGLSDQQQFQLLEALFDDDSINPKPLKALQNFIHLATFKDQHPATILKCLEWAAICGLEVSNASAILQTIKLSESERDDNGFDRFPMDETFRYYRLLAVHKLIPTNSKNEQNSHKRDVLDLLSSMATLINSSASASFDIGPELKRIISSTREIYENETTFPFWNPLDEEAKDRLLIIFVRQLISKYTESHLLAEALRSIWEEDQDQRFFSPFLRRELVNQFVGRLANDYIEQRLDEVETIMMDNWYYVSKRMVEYARQSRAWLKIKCMDKAETCLKRMLSLSYGIDHKMHGDLTHWSAVMHLANIEDPKNAAKRINTMVSAMVSAYSRSSNGNASNEYEEFLKEIYSFSPVTVAKLFIGLEESDVVNSAARAYKALTAPSTAPRRRPKYDLAKKVQNPPVTSFDDLVNVAKLANLDWEEALQSIAPLTKQQAKELRRIIGTQRSASTLFCIAKHISDKDYAFSLLQDVLAMKYVSPGLPMKVLKQMNLLNSAKTKQLVFQSLGDEDDSEIAINFHLPSDLITLMEILEFKDFSTIWESVSNQINQMTMHWGFSIHPLPDNHIYEASTDKDAMALLENAARK